MKRKQSPVTELLTAAEFERRVNDSARFTHLVLIGDHVLVDNVDRRITRMMIIRALRKGTIASGPKWDANYSNWVGKMHYLATGIDLKVVCALKDRTLTVTVVTAYGNPK